MIIIPDIIDEKTIQQFRLWLDEVKWQNGKTTAGPFAASVKNNLQATPDDDGRISQMQQIIAHKLVNNLLFKTYAKPKTIIEILFSKYETDHEYGLHVDNSMMHETRVDLAFTLFLSSPYEFYTDGYEDGSLLIGDDTKGIREPAGTVVVYPANTLHRVTPVSKGVRLAAVGWVRSYIRDTEKRELLFELSQARDALFEKHGKTPEFDRLCKSVANLSRMWVED